jgi:hypothetical protein
LKSFELLSVGPPFRYAMTGLFPPLSRPLAVIAALTPWPMNLPTVGLSNET